MSPYKATPANDKLFFGFLLYSTDGMFQSLTGCRERRSGTILFCLSDAVLPRQCSSEKRLHASFSVADSTSLRARRQLNARIRLKIVNRVFGAICHKAKLRGTPNYEENKKTSLASNCFRCRPQVLSRDCLAATSSQAKCF